MVLEIVFFASLFVIFKNKNIFKKQRRDYEKTTKKPGTAKKP